MGSHRLSKKERLNRKKIIEGLFEKGPSNLIFPLKIISIPHPDPDQILHQVLVTVPSKNFKKAVDRNLLKRRIREGYRLNKSMLTLKPPHCLAYIYVAKEILSSAVIHKSIRSSLERLNSYEKKN